MNGKWTFEILTPCASLLTLQEMLFIIDGYLIKPYGTTIFMQYWLCNANILLQTK